MSAHAKFSPSGAARWMRCHASIAMESGLPDQENEFSREGTAAHEIAQGCLTNDAPASYYLDKLTTNGWKVTEDMVEHVQSYVDKLREYANGHTLMVEQRLDFGSHIDVEDQFGTSDGVIITADGEELQAHDLKYGLGVEVDAYEVLREAEYDATGAITLAEVRGPNPQLALYALGALTEFAMMGDFKRARFVIHQPRRKHLSEWDCTIEELLAFAERAKTAAMACQNAETFKRLGTLPDDSSYFNPGEKQCRFCKAKATCKALASHVIESVFGPDCDDFEDLTAAKAPAPVPTEADRLGLYMGKLPLIEAWMKAIRSETEKRMLAGEEVPGWKLVAGRAGSRKWSDQEQAEATLKGMRLKQEDMYDFSLISPTTAEKRLAKESPRKWKKLQPLITQSPGGKSIAPASDRRPAIVAETTGADDFEDLTQQIAAV